MADRRKLPLIYSCSGCSSAAQMANSIAVSLDRSAQLEMSCIAGVGGDIKPLVRVAKSGRPIVAVDGCALQCVKACLRRHDVIPNQHFVLADFGVEKKQHGSFDESQAREISAQIMQQLSDDGFLARAEGNCDSPVIQESKPDTPLRFAKESR